MCTCIKWVYCICANFWKMQYFICATRLYFICGKKIKKIICAILLKIFKMYFWMELLNIAQSIFFLMYTMHGCKNGNYVHLLYALLARKSEVCHQQMWFLLFQLCEQRNLTLTPHSIHINFEQAMHYVILHVLPGTKSDCCRFHLGQNWWRKIQDLGLSTEYKEKTCDIRKCWVIICTTRTDWRMFCWGHLLFTMCLPVLMAQM